MLITFMLFWILGGMDGFDVTFLIVLLYLFWGVGWVDRVGDFHYYV